MAEEMPIQDGQIEFRYPKLPCGFLLACHLVILFILTSFLFGVVPHKYLLMYFFVIAAYLFLMSVHVWDWIGLLSGAKGSIIVGAEGIKVGKKYAAWDQIEEIKHGIWPVRAGSIRLKLKKEKRPFFEFALKTKPKALFIQAYPFVYRELIPAIKTIRPDLPVSPVVERAMEDPEGSIAPRRWLLAILFAANVILLNALLLPRFQTLISYFAIAFAISSVESYLKPWAFKLVHIEKDKFIEFGLNCSIFVSPIIGLRALSLIEPIIADTTIITAITVSLLSFMVLFSVKELTTALKIIILCVLAGVPTAAYAYSRSQEWPSKNITGLLCGDDISTAAWGNYGRYFTTAWYEGQGCVIDAETLERTLVPAHNGKINTIWLDERFLIRRVAAEDENDGGFVPELRVYDFNKHQEFKVPTSRGFSVGQRRPVDYAGKRLAWIEAGEQKQFLRFYNIESMNEDMDSTELPQDVNWNGGQAVWVNEKEMAVCVKRIDEGYKEEARRLYVLKVNLETGGREMLKSSRKYEKWNPVNDFQNAFGINDVERFEKYSCDFLSLKEDKITPVAGDDFPLEAKDVECAYHVVEEKIRAYLARFDFNTGQDQRLLRVPKAMRVQGVSLSGRFVLLGVRGFLNFPNYMVIDVAGGKRHWIHLPGMFGAERWPQLIASIPGTSPFSADERWLILETLGADGVRTFLFEIPEKWRGSAK